MNICVISGHITKQPLIIGDGQSFRFAVLAPYFDHPSSGREHCALVHCVIINPNESQKKRLQATNAAGLYVEFTGRVAMTRYGTNDDRAVNVMDVIIDEESFIIRGDK